MKKDLGEINLFKYPFQEALAVMERVPKIANDAMHVELIHGYEV